MIKRDSTWQEFPPENLDLSRFPKRTVSKGRSWYREHGILGPWYFASGDGGRFNLETPRGSLYLASTPQAAARERIGWDLAKSGRVPYSLVEGRQVATLNLPATLRLAKLTAPDAVHWQLIPNELTTMPNYAVPRAWAAAFDQQHFDGLWVMLRTGTPDTRGIVWFGKSGTRDWGAAAEMPLLEILRSIEIRIVGPPSSTQLTIVTA